MTTPVRSFRPPTFPILLALLMAAITLAPATMAQDAPKREGIATGFDSIWTGANIPTQEATGLERIMLSDDKILVVLGVVLIIWFGIIGFLLRNDRRIGQLERELENHRSDF